MQFFLLSLLLDLLLLDSLIIEWALGLGRKHIILACLVKWWDHWIQSWSLLLLRHSRRELILILRNNFLYLHHVIFYCCGVAQRISSSHQLRSISRLFHLRIVFPGDILLRSFFIFSFVSFKHLIISKTLFILKLLALVNIIFLVR